MSRDHAQIVRKQEVRFWYERMATSQYTKKTKDG